MQSEINLGLEKRAGKYSQRMPFVTKKKPRKKKKILITGACGGLACEVSRVLCDEYELVGMILEMKE